MIIRIPLYFHLGSEQQYVQYKRLSRERADRNPQAYFAQQNGDWWLVNQVAEAMVVIAGAATPNKLISNKQGEALRDGMQIQLSRAGRGRLAVVQMA